MDLVRKLVIAALKFNVHFRALHIPGSHKTTADLLSRLQVQQALKRAPHLCPSPTTVPPHMLPRG